MPAAPKPVRERKPTLSVGERAVVAMQVLDRDRGCVAAQLDATHRCEGRLTYAHVPELGKNAYGKKPPFDRYHLVVECLAANSGGTRPWSETHRDLERAYLALKYPGFYE